MRISYFEADRMPCIIKLVSSEIGFGGGEQIFLDLAKAFMELGIKVQPVTPKNSKLSEALAQEELFKAQNINTTQNINKNLKAKVLVANDFKSLFRFSPVFGLKRALVCHGPWELTWKKKIYMRMYRVHLLCVSNYVAAFANKGIGMRKSMITILEYGPDMKQIHVSSTSKAKAREKFGLASKAVVIGSLSRYHSVKRIDELIEIFRGRDEILLLGLSKGFNTEDEIQTKKQIDEIELPTNVVIFENVKNTEFLDAIDALISFSKSETLGLTFLEAAARGIPSFTTAKGGVNDYLIHGFNGYFLNNQTLQENANEFFSKLREKNLLERLARNSQQINNDRNPRITATQILGKIL